MFFALILTIVVIAGGTVVTYLYDDDANFGLRLCAGACLGLTSFGLVGFVFALLMGLTTFSVCASAAVIALPLLFLTNPRRLNAVQGDISRTCSAIWASVKHPSLSATGTLLFFLAFAVLMWLVFDRVIFEQNGALYTGALNNFGDLPFHISVISSFAKGENFPPEDPTFAGIRFTYPFIVDLVAAMFMRAGASLQDSLFIENIVLAVSTVGLLWRFGLAVTRDRLAAIFTVLLVIFSGGVGWLRIYLDIQKSSKGLFALLANLPSAEYSIVPNTTFRWGNMISALLLPQRSLLMGLPIALIVFTLWWKAWVSTEEKESEGQGYSGPVEDPKKKNGKGAKHRKEEKNPAVATAPGSPELSTNRLAQFVYHYTGLPYSISSRSMLAAGLIAGLLPLVHAHTFASIMVVGLGLAVVGGIGRWPQWILFFAAATLVGAPQMLWAISGSAVQTSRFFGFEFGWDHGTDSIFFFWLKNTGLFIPLLIIALVGRGKEPFVPKRLLLFYLPFTLCFIIPNSVKLAPWIWDNIKVLIYWWVASAPIVALLLARLWRRGRYWTAVSAFMLITLTLAGGLDVYRIASRQSELQEFDRDGVRFSSFVEQQTPPKALVLHAMTHNHPMFLAGRRSVMGYPGHIWTHGLDFKQRETDIRVMYAGGYDALPLMKQYGIDYVVVSGIENSEMNVNNQFFNQRLTKVGEVGDYRLYKVAR